MSARSMSAAKRRVPGVRIDNIGAADVYSFMDAIFWGNAPGLDFVATCDTGCGKIRINVSYSMVQTQYRHPEREDLVRRRHRGAGRSAVRRSGEGRLPSEVRGGALDADRLCEGLCQQPVLAKGYPEGSTNENPERAGKQNELGAYGNSGEASFVR